MKSQVRIPKITKKITENQPKFSIEAHHGEPSLKNSGGNVEVATGNMVPYKYRYGSKTWGINENYRI